MSNNLKNLRKKFRISAQQLADKCGISRAYLYDLEKLTKIPFDHEEMLIKIFSCKKEDLYLNEKNLDSLQSSLVKLKYFPDIEMSVAKGIQIEDQLTSPCKMIDMELLQFFTASKELSRYDNISLIRVNGDSMDPVLQKGNWVVADHNQCVPLESNEIFIVQNIEYNTVFIKYIRQKITGGYEITSANKYYSSDNILIQDLKAKSSFKIIGKVIACIKDI